MKTATNIQARINNIPQGQPFTSTELLHCGSRAAIDQALCRLASTHRIVRLTRGVYVKPEKNAYVGEVLPSPFKIAQVIANKTGEIIQVSGAEAARIFGLSTQVPAHPVFLTTGQSRNFMLGHLNVTLKHVSKKKIPLYGSKIGLAITALWYLGKKEVNLHVIKQIQKKLTGQEFITFLSSKAHMPIWMNNVVLQYERTL